MAQLTGDNLLWGHFVCVLDAILAFSLLATPLQGNEAVTKR